MDCGRGRGVIVSLIRYLGYTSYSHVDLRVPTLHFENNGTFSHFYFIPIEDHYYPIIFATYIPDDT